MSDYFAFNIITDLYTQNKIFDDLIVIKVLMKIE